MRVVLQRVAEASVTVTGEIVGRIDHGLLLLAAIGRDDDEAAVRKMARKCIDLRVFAGEAGHFEHSVRETGGSVLAVSQFTLYGDCAKGRRPSLSKAARPEEAERLFSCFVETVREEGVPVETGSFGADMKVRLLNDGPVTFQLET